MSKRVPFPYRIAGLYIIISALWIVFSDLLVLRITTDPVEINRLSTYKGWFFVLTTGTLLFFLIRNEIRRRNKIYEELLQEKERAAEADRLKTAFLSNLSHYIRTPMNSILGFIEILEDQDTSPDKREVFLSYIQESSDNLLRTLKNIIEISHIQEGQTKASVQAMHINEMIMRIINTAKVDVEESEKPILVKHALSLADGQDLFYSDEGKVQMILSLLISNSLRFTDHGEIEIGYAISKPNIQFWVRDTGRGIPESRRSVLFQDFMHITSMVYTKGEGAGLGLILATRLAELLGGQLWLESTSESGTTICFSIPIITQPYDPA